MSTSMRASPSLSLAAAALLVCAGCMSAPSLPSKPSSSHDSSSQSGGDPSSASRSDPKPSPAPASASSAASSPNDSAPSQPAAAQTPEERRAALDRRLDDSLGGFDAVLKKEQQRVAQEHDTRAAEAGGSATTEAQSADKAGSANAAGTAATETPRAGAEGSGDTDKHRGSDKKAAHPGDLKSEKAGKVDDNAGNGASAREIPDGSDDDVVARRLRKAAEQETDPELKEKLWHEYIEYKKNTQGK